MPKTYWLLNDVAKHIGVDPQTVLYWHRHGRLVPSARTPRGVRLYDPKVVERFRQQRRKAKGR